MTAPGTQLDVNSLGLHLTSAALECRVRQSVYQTQGLAFRVAPRHAYTGLCRTVAQVHDDEVPRVIPGPTPGNQVQVARIVRPAGPLAEGPLAIAKDRIIDGFEKLGIESAQFLVREFLRSPAEKHRWAHLTAFELPLMEKAGSRE